MPVTEAKILSGASVVATPTSDRSHVAIDIHASGSERIRLLLTLPQARSLFLHLDLATAAMGSAEPARS